MPSSRSIDPEVIPPVVRDTCARLQSAGFEVHLVGGCVRDILLGRPLGDWDVTTNATPDVVQRLFTRVIPTGIEHLTVTVLAGSGENRLPIEITTYRGEGAYTDGRRPERVHAVRTLAEDVARRDFTVNALALDSTTGQVVDLVDGLVDLEARRLRAVGDPLARFREDGLRTMRAVRFAATLGFELEAATEQAIPGAIDVFRRVSVERIRDELLKILSATPPSKPSVGFELMRRTGLLSAALPELVPMIGARQNRFHRYDVWQHTLAAVDAAPPDPLLRLAVLLHDVGKPATAAPRTDAPEENTFYRHEIVGAAVSDEIMRRLKLSNDDRTRVRRLVEHHMFWYEPAWTDASVRRFVRRVGSDLLEDLFRLRAADVLARGRGEDPEVELGELRERVARVLHEAQALTVGQLAVDGHDLMRELALPPGRAIGEILRRLLERVIEDPSLNVRERLVAAARDEARTLAGPKP